MTTTTPSVFLALALLPLSGAADSVKVEKTDRVGRRIENEYFVADLSLIHNGSGGHRGRGDGVERSAGPAGGLNPSDDSVAVRVSPFVTTN